MDLIRFWFAPSFPKKHIANILSYKPGGLVNRIRNYYRTWVVHPVRRRISRFYVWLLQQFFGLKVVGITGSTGKTTVKEMLASILRLSGGTVYSFANIDPIYNIPTTILKCKPSTKFLVLEMGVEYPSEIDFYLWLVKPQIGVITNIYPTHTLYFKNKSGVFREKSKLVKELSKDDFAILSCENDFLRSLGGKIDAKTIWYGGNSDVYVTGVTFTKDFRTRFTLHLGSDSTHVNLPILGRQFVYDALAAAAVAYALGIKLRKIKKGLESFEMQDHRMSIKRLKFGTILIDDSYNNNPEAAREAIKTLKEVARERKTLLIFGDMLELGKNEINYHKEIKEFIGGVDIDCVVGIGNLSKYVVSDKKFWAEDWQNAIPIVESILGKDLTILVKGSRSMQLDRLVDILVSRK